MSKEEEIMHCAKRSAREKNTTTTHIENNVEDMFTVYIQSECRCKMYHPVEIFKKICFFLAGIW